MNCGVKFKWRQKHTEKALPSILCALHSNLVLIQTKTTQKKEAVNEGEITTVNRWFGKIQQPISYYRLNNLEKHNFSLKTIRPSMFFTH